MPTNKASGGSKLPSVEELKTRMSQLGIKLGGGREIVKQHLVDFLKDGKPCTMTMVLKEIGRGFISKPELIKLCERNRIPIYSEEEMEIIKAAMEKN